MQDLRADAVAEDEILSLRGGLAWGSYAPEPGREAGPRFGNHSHYELELGILLKGKVRRYYPSWEMEVGPGQVWLCGIWEQHRWESLETPCGRLALFILPTALARLCLDMGAGANWMLPFRVPPQERPQAHGRMREELLTLGRRAAAKVGEENRPEQAAWALLTALEALHTLCEGWQPPVWKGPSLISDHTVMERAIEMVFTSTGLVTVQAAAQACGMNRNTFSTWFKWHTGISFPKFALCYRVSRAAQQLADSNDPVKAVAKDWGFADVGHLYRCFMHHYGCSPAAYRKAHS